MDATLNFTSRVAHDVRITGSVTHSSCPTVCGQDSCRMPRPRRCPVKGRYPATLSGLLGGMELFRLFDSAS